MSSGEEKKTPLHFGCPEGKSMYLTLQDPAHTNRVNAIKNNMTYQC